MTPDLGTTNALLAILAAVSVLEALALLALMGGGYLLYRRIVRVIEGIEARQVAPVTARVNAILDDVKGVTFVARHAAEGADASMRWGLGWVMRRIRSMGRAA